MNDDLLNQMIAEKCRVVSPYVVGNVEHTAYDKGSAVPDQEPGDGIEGAKARLADDLIAHLPEAVSFRRLPAFDVVRDDDTKNTLVTLTARWTAA